MTKTPPNRRGITFEVGAQLEARDSLKNWYAANIEKIDYDDEKVLIHYRQWSHRYDEWFDWTSPYLRPVERIQLRRQGLQEDAPIPELTGARKMRPPHCVMGFHVNDKVLASWSDCRFYPAKVLAVNKDASYVVKFYDGVVQTVKGIHVKPFVKERRTLGGGKARSSDKNGVRKTPNGRERKPQENGAPKSKRARRSTSDQEDSNSEEDEDDEEEEEGDEWGDGPANHDKAKKKDCQGEGPKDAPPTVKQEEGKPRQPIGQNKLRDVGDEEGLTNGVKQEEEEGEEGGGGDGPKGESCPPPNGALKEEVPAEVNGTKPYAGSPSQTSASQTGQVSVATTTPPTATCDEKAEAKPASQSDGPGQAAAPPPAQPVKPVRKQGFHNPNRFSREPLYRVIKNQPPPVLSINLDHNPFKCSTPGCTKSFRKAKLLHYHMKYYHGQEQPPQDTDLSPTRSVHTRASEKQAAATPQETPKRRRTVSSSTSSTHSGGAAASARGDVKAGGRRTSAPPSVGATGPQQRALLREKSKENQLDRNGCPPPDRDGEKSGFDLGLVKENNKQRDKLKQKDFLRIKLKKKKKKKVKSDEDSLSDWSTDSCGWSDDDFGVELGVSTPPLSVGSVALDNGDQEIVRCICEVEEENDFMIQCEECLCWQHGTCMGLLEENVPDRYACYICRDPPGQRQSLRYWYDREWLSNGHMYGLSFLEENYSHQNAKKIAATHQLLGDVHNVVEVLNGLQLKMSVLQNKTHPDLRLWCQPWKLAERPWRTYDSCPGTDAVPSPMAPDEDMSRGEILMSNALEKLSRAATSTAATNATNNNNNSSAAAAGAASSSSSSSSSSASSSSSLSPYRSFLDSYISSEHCYQKPRAYYPAVEQRLVVETRQGSELEDSLRSTEDLLEREQRYGTLLDPDRPRAPSASTKASVAGWWSQVEGKEEKVVCGGGTAGDSRQQQWQINLLDHIDAVQDQVSHRMDFIERELDVLESWLDYSGELEPPEPLARLPQLKRRVKQLLCELSKVQQISLCCST